MPIQQLPLMKGIAKSQVNADYIDAMPVNMLAVPKEVLDSSGYLRSFPGIDKRDDVAGLSRGVQFNTHESVVYRVLGNKLYRGQSQAGDVSGSSRVGMAHSATSQAVAANGVLTLYRYDGTVKTLQNWPSKVGDVTYAQYEIGSVRDVCRLRGRYIWVKDGSQDFGVTDLEDESHPDQYRPFYTAESQPDGILGCDSWRDFAVMFGTSTIEYFSLTGATDTSAAIYVAQPSLMVQKGIAGTFAKCRYADSHAFVSNPANGSPSVYVISQGSATQISSVSVDKVLKSYSATDLAQVYMESLRFDGHELIIIHLPNDVLCYDASASQNGPQWSILKTGLYDEPYRAIDFMYEGNQIICGDKTQSVTGYLNDAHSSQHDAEQEHLLYTPLFKADNNLIFDFELESSTGISQKTLRLFLSATTDGINFGREQMISQSRPFEYDRRVLWRRIGRIRKNVGFKVRVITMSPVTLSGCQVRIE
ncbi:packaged DNA stabilization protein [Rosenbergiella nectarea]|uniref:packaged DNA stabilization protein n=1 Tax=Rosenbergiella nectarea TaxID=988801 RepID=UPI001BD9CDD7|nr:packaged DNA stabilization protein [Rosenbergiella nectarea]MBT0729516.1 hypothetical protein [Rosenbergiella nectarea subsp. apis]